MAKLLVPVVVCKQSLPIYTLLGVRPFENQDLVQGDKCKIVLQILKTMYLGALGAIHTFFDL